MISVNYLKEIKQGRSASRNRNEESKTPIELNE